MLTAASEQITLQLLAEVAGLSDIQLVGLKQQAATAGKGLLALVAEQKLIDFETLARITAASNGMNYVKLSGLQVSPAVLKLLPQGDAETYMVVPFGMMGDKLAVGMLDPSNIQAVDFVTRKVGYQLNVFLASRASVDHILSQYRVDLTDDVLAAVSSIAAEPTAPVATSAKQLETMVQDAPITRTLNAIMDYAIESRASDIHIEPREKDLKIRFRVDGVLLDTMTLPKTIEPALISRVKILSNLKIDEHRIPQDGQFQSTSKGKQVDLRIAIAPTVYGEEVVIRLLDKTNQILTLEALGFRGRAFKIINEGIRKPHGMTLSTGPTGSGKSTSLYAIVQEIKDVSINIVTLEDPVEYKMEGINQIQVNPAVGLTFATGLRSILRQDPNVIMVGEIRDKETADLAVQASLTGHVVLSTLHTNSAAGVLPRLLDMGVEPFLIASTVNTVIGQRLVRRLCQSCKITYASSKAQTTSINQTLGDILPKTATDVVKTAQDLGYDNLPLAGQNAYTLFKAPGCNECNKGLRGRIGIYEVFNMTPVMEQLLVRHATTSEVQTEAEKAGMVTMKQDGYLKALSGITTLEEVSRVAADF